MIYNMLYLVKHPTIENHFLVGIDAYCEFGYVMDNGRFINGRRMIFAKSLNPWGVKGECLEIIQDYFYELEDRMNTSTLIHNLHPFELSIRITMKGNVDKPGGVALSLLDIMNDFETACHHPVSFSDDTPFDMEDESMTIQWADIVYWMKDKMTLIKSSRLFTDNKTFNELMKPYYVIHVRKSDIGELYLVSDKDVGSALSNQLCYAGQFRSLDMALKFAGKKPKHLKDGFEIREIQAPKSNAFLRVC